MDSLDFGKLFDLIGKFIEAPTVSLFFIVFGICVLGILAIAKYCWDRNRREKQAWAETQKIKKEQIEITHKVQQDSAMALIQNMDTTNKIDYDFFVLKIRSEQYASIYLKLHESIHTKAGEIMYNEELTPQVRAASLIKLKKGLG